MRRDTSSSRVWSMRSRWAIFSWLGWFRLCSFRLSFITVPKNAAPPSSMYRSVGKLLFFRAKKPCHVLESDAWAYSDSVPGEEEVCVSVRRAGEPAATTTSLFRWWWLLRCSMDDLLLWWRPDG